MNKGNDGMASCMPTVFELIVSGDIPSHKVAEGKLWYAFLDIAPRREGHTLVVPKRATSRLCELTTDEHAALMKGVCEVQARLGQVFDTNDFTVCLHDGPLAGQEVPHVHFHVLPRTHGDGGKSLMAMWPAQPAADPPHDRLAALAKQLTDVGA